MKEGDYGQTREHLLLIGRLVAEMPLQEFVEAIDRAESFTPFFDPTLYQQYLADPHAREDNRTLVKLAQLLVSYQTIIRELKAKHEVAAPAPGS